MNRMMMCTLLAAASVLSAAAQTSSAASAIAPPDTGILVNYTYSPTQYVQWIGAELPYSMMMLTVDGTSKQPVLDATLTDHAGKRVHYTNSDTVVASATAQGEEAHKTSIAFEPADTETVGSVTSLRFSMADGKALQWRFVQGSDISEQGSGLTALPDAKIPIFAYREQGAVAGEGTALQIGDVVSTAEVWKEISHPPYFVGYHGAMTESAHTLVFVPGKQTWTVASSPATLAAGGTWELDSDKGNHRTLHIDKVEGAHFVITGSDRFAPAARFTLEAVRGADGWSIERVRYAPVHDGDKHSLTMQFAAPLSASSTSSELSLIVGKKKTIAGGSIAASGAAADRTLTLSFATPEWAKGKSMSEETVSAGGSMTVTAHP